MKVIINAVSARSGGGLIYLCNLLRVLPAVCSEIHFVAVVPNIGLPDFGHQNLTLCVADQASGNSVSRYLWENTVLLKLIKKHKADILFCLANVVPLRKLNIPVVTVIQNIAPLHRKLLYDKLRTESLSAYLQLAFMKMLTLTAIRRSAAIISLSAFADNLVKSYHKPVRSKIIHHGVSEIFSPDARRPENIDNSKYFVFVSNIYLYKGLEYLIEALASDSDLPKVVVIGKVFDHNYFASIQKQIAEHGLSQRIIFLSSVPNESLAGWYCHAEALVYPSWCESFGMPALEALRCGCPVVAFKDGSIEEVCGILGFYAEPHSGKSLAKAMRKAMECDRNDYRKKAYRHACTFTWEESMRQYGSFLGSISQIRQNGENFDARQRF